MHYDERFLNALRRAESAGRAVGWTLGMLELLVRIGCLVAVFYLVGNMVGEVHAIHELLFEQRCR